ncbi:MAG TPA: HAMP domain-containing sensor histidine kinase [Acidisarcina sp.]
MIRDAGGGYASSPGSANVLSGRQGRLKKSSITRRLIGTVLLVEIAAAICVSGAVLAFERRAHFRTFDIMLRGRADSILGAVQDAGDPGDNVMVDKTELNLPPDDVYEVRDPSGRIVGRSPNWDGPPDALILPHEDGILSLRLGGKPYRAIRLHGVRVVDPGDKGGGVPRPVTVLYGAPTINVWRAVNAAAEFYAAVNVLLLLITGTVMAWLLSRSLEPLRVLAAEASGVSVNSWSFHPPESALALKELEPLAVALESVMQRLERSFMQQRRFVGDAAHELKTGVAVVKSSLQLLAMKPRTPEEYQAGLERCEADCARMEEMVYEMLTLARIDAAERPAATLVPSDIAGCIRQVADQFSTMASLRQVNIVVLAAEALHVLIRAQECQLLVSNLVLNAIQHSYAQSQVTVSAVSEGDEVVLKVEDRGEGISAAVLPHVFERFFRGDASRDRSTGGTGLGLAICKAIVDQAGGSIEVQSNNDVGTIVTVRLPLVDPA